jgi:hypothetical protein
LVYPRGAGSPVLMAWNPWGRPWGDAPPERWLDAWASATSWWTQPVVQGGQALVEVNARLLAELADGLMRRFEGRRVELQLGGARVEAVLESIRLRRVAERFTGRLELSDVVWDGLAIDALSAVAGTVSLLPDAPARLTIADIELTGSAPVDALVGWLGRRVEGWSLAVDEDGRVEARGRRPGLTFVVEPVVEEHELHGELRALRCAGVRVAIPSWLRIVRTMPLPALPRGATIADARRRAGTVDFRVRVSALSERFDPARVRDAVFTGGPVALT